MPSWNGCLGASTGSGFFKTSLRARQGSSIESHQRWREGTYHAIEATLSLEGEGLTVAEQCHTAEVSRAGFYRYLHQAKIKQADNAMLDAYRRLGAHE